MLRQLRRPSHPLTMSQESVQTVGNQLRPSAADANRLSIAEGKRRISILVEISAFLNLHFLGSANLGTGREEATKKSVKSFHLLIVSIHTRKDCHYQTHFV